MNLWKYAHRLLLTRLIFIFSMAAVFGSYSFAAENNLRFVINAPGAAPYIYFDKQQSRYQGVVVDFFNSFNKRDVFNVEYIDSSRSRNEQLVFTEKADLFFGSSVWITDPDRFLYSAPIMTHTSFLYSTKMFETPFSFDVHNQALICTRRGYKYPYLQPYFDNKSLLRVDSISQTTMTHMLGKGRCDYAVMSQENAWAIMSHPQFCEYEFHQSSVPISLVGLTFVMGKKLTEERDKINQQISSFINSGQRDKSMQKHLSQNTFPKLVCE
ncbi:transporter substrate-binding domain-containing protein [Paraglaciecola aquimarina]|uniref:Transporter substrate-binding domain-containing protein n=1 Tax=Paraglaciecola algarum TaxID=3050085 RepID=A0ABS9D4Z1_9ALTE|nr:transporter substrate-binding domain-containing protein [Paraglaciecola sp. G1-23]MCF2948013.1 transporter substrate-binding domain-containing protein [Paraglaciecola sp. G1-23]